MSGKWGVSLSDSYILQMDGMNITVTRKRMKNLRLKVTPDGEIAVSAPYGVTRQVVDEFILSKRQWIARQRERAVRLAAAHDRLGPGGAARFWGQWFEIEHLRAARRRVTWAEPGRLVVCCQRASEIPQLMNGLRRDETARLARPLVDRWQTQLRLPVPSLIRYRAMTSRWGSCNHSARSLNFNTRLSRYPVEALEYVVVHELAHLRFPDHGREFWALVGDALPDFRDRRALLSDDV